MSGDNTTDICAECGAVEIPMIEATIRGVEEQTLCVPCIEKFAPYFVAPDKGGDDRG